MSYLIVSLHFASSLVLVSSLSFLPLSSVGSCNASIYKTPKVTQPEDNTQVILATQALQCAHPSLENPKAAYKALRPKNNEIYNH